jgi:hypothetical protein
MKFNVILGCVFALAGIAAAVPGPRCIKRADPDREDAIRKLIL